MDTNTQSKDMIDSLASVETHPFDDNDDDEGDSPLLHSQSCSALMDGTHDERDDDLFPQTLSESDILQESVDSKQTVSQDQELHRLEQQDQESVDSKQQSMNQDEKPTNSEETGGQEQEFNSSQQTTNQTPEVSSESRQTKNQNQVVDGSQLATGQTDVVDDISMKDESADAGLESEPTKSIDDATQTSQNNEDTPGNYNPDGFETNGSLSELSNQTTDLSHQSADVNLVTNEEYSTKHSTVSANATNTDEAIVSTHVAGSCETNQDSSELKVVPNLVLETIDEDHHVDSNKSTTDSKWKSPPPTPRTASLARDVQNLLDSLRAPLSADEAEQIVRVPSVSRNNHYYRHSLKRRNIVRQEESKKSETSQVKMTQNLIVTDIY